MTKREDTLDFIFTANSFYLDETVVSMPSPSSASEASLTSTWRTRFIEDKYKALYNSSFENVNVKPSDSGKFEILMAICETLHEKREKVIIFTQFNTTVSTVDGASRSVDTVGEAGRTDDETNRAAAFQ
ncbi:MAG: hypothetical protein IJQ24_10460 [Synergistaceae bacterium]|nr:hypothetical protein [Synergistaceae bacterium]